MKKNLFNTVILILATGCTVFSQTLVTQVKPMDSKTWGYANLKGELIIPPQYSKCYEFSAEGFAAVYDNKQEQYCFINLKGEKLATEISGFKLREGFKGGLALFNQGEKWGYLDVKGKVAIAAKYDDASDFDDGSASAKMGDKFLVLNAKGEEFLISGADIKDLKKFSEGLAPYVTKDKKFGFIGPDGKIAIPAQYESVGYFTAGLAWAKTGDGMLGYINPKGEWAIKPQFNVGKDFDKVSGLARIKKGDKWAYVNKAGELIYVNDTEVWGDFSEGLCDGKKNDKKGFYDASGKWVIEPQFDGTRDFKNGYAAAKKGDKWGMIDKQGKWVIQPTFDGIKDMEAVK